MVNYSKIKLKKIPIKTTIAPLAINSESKISEDAWTDLLVCIVRYIQYWTVDYTNILNDIEPLSHTPQSDYNEVI